MGKKGNSQAGRAERADLKDDGQRAHEALEE